MKRHSDNGKGWRSRIYKVFDVSVKTVKHMHILFIYFSFTLQHSGLYITLYISLSACRQIGLSAWTRGMKLRKKSQHVNITSRLKAAPSFVLHPWLFCTIQTGRLCNQMSSTCKKMKDSTTATALLLLQCCPPLLLIHLW